MKLLQERKSHALILIVTLESLMPEDMDVIILNQEGVVLNVELIGVMSVKDIKCGCAFQASITIALAITPREKYNKERKHKKRRKNTS